MMILLSVLGLVACFYLLAKICDDYFVESLDLIAKRFKLSEDVAGATLMAIGSSAPELFTSLIALTKAGSENVGAGTIVGSAIFNVLVIVGASAVAAKAFLSWQPVIRDMLFYIVAIIILLLTFSDGRITLFESCFFVLGYVLYIGLLWKWKNWFPAKKVTNKTVETPKLHHEQETNIISKSANWLLSLVLVDVEKHPKYYIRTFLVSILSIGALSWVLVELAVVLAHALGISEVIIALTVLAAGTSVPDLLSSIIVARQGRGEMAVSNAVGSNTFDILIGLGLPWLLYTSIQGHAVEVSTENLLSSAFLLFFTVVSLLFLLIVQRFNIGHKSGYLLLALYVGYLGFALYSAYYPVTFF